MGSIGEEVENEAVNIAQRVKLFSGNNNLKKKPLPKPRRHAKTEEIPPINSAKPTNLPKKPAIPQKPQLGGGRIKTTRPVSSPPNYINKKINPPKPAPPSKPPILEKISDEKKHNVSWKKAAGPPKSPPPTIPASDTPPQKPRRVRDRTQLEYENAELSESKVIKNQPNNISYRSDTLDGLSFSNAITKNNTEHTKVETSQSSPLNVRPTVHPFRKSFSQTDCVDDDSSDDENCYEDPYEPSVPTHQNNNTNGDDNIYDEADPSSVQAFKYHQQSHYYQPHDNIYDEADPGCIGGFIALVNEQNGDSDQDLYEDPHESMFQPPVHMQPQVNNNDSSDDEDYEEPPHDLQPPVPPPHKTASVINTTAVDSSDSEDNYDEPVVDNLPQIPKHMSQKHSPLTVPSHSKPRSENNLQTSSDDDDDDDVMDYTDPETWLHKPPVPLNHGAGHNNTIRRAPNLGLDEYMPATVQDDDFMANSMYMDPATAFENPPVVLNQDNEQMYSDEPLYQVYTAEMMEEFRRESKKSDKSSEEEQEFLGDSGHLTRDLLKVGSKTSLRMLWAELPNVRESGILNTIEEKERKRQEAVFEVITSEASYLKSLDILVSRFMMSKEFLPNPNLPSETNPNESQIIDRQQYHFLFSGVSAVKAASERFLRDLRKRQEDKVLLGTISDIVLEYAENNFNSYIKYCSNQVFQDRTLQALANSSTEFSSALNALEADPVCQGLSMHSFLTMPMQRICRLPLLIDAILSRCEPESEEYKATDKALKAINVVVHDCNEGARKMERTEEMYYIQKTLTFKTKPIPLVSSSRWLVKKGLVSCLLEENSFSRYKNRLRQIFKGKCKSIYLFLFTDLVIVTKMKSEDNFKVIDYCQRSLLKVEELTTIPDPEPPKVGTLQVNPLKYAFTLVLLENCHGKTVDYHCFLNTTTDKTRWLEAFKPKPVVSEKDQIEGESIYDVFDCPQVQVVHSYQAQQSDELTIFEGDVLKVLRKLPDGWAEGQRLRDDEKGWFPINHTFEVDSKHMRAKHLMQRYRLVTASKSIVNNMLK